MDNTIIYLLGHSGSGKYTIGKQLARLYDFRLVDNHYVNNVIFSLIETDGKTKLPEKVWDYTRSVRKAVFGTIKELSSPSASFIFTNALVKEQENSEKIYADVLDIVNYRKAKFFTVILDISKEELKKRISSPERKAQLKDISQENAERAFDSLNIYQPINQMVFHIDVNQKTAKESAEEIMKRIRLTLP